MQNNQMADAVVRLHEIAQLIEREIGSGNLSEDIRACADRLDVLTQPFKLVRE